MWYKENDNFVILFRIIIKLGSLFCRGQCVSMDDTSDFINAVLKDF